MSCVINPRYVVERRTDRTWGIIRDTVTGMYYSKSCDCASCEGDIVRYTEQLNRGYLRNQDIWWATI